MDEQETTPTTWGRMTDEEIDNALRKHADEITQDDNERDDDDYNTYMANDCAPEWRP